MEVFTIYKGFTKMNIRELFTKDSNVTGTCSEHHTLKLEKLGCTVDNRKVFSHKLAENKFVDSWNSLDKKW